MYTVRIRPRKKRECDHNDLVDAARNAKREAPLSAGTDSRAKEIRVKTEVH